jgi:hypothetical protein
MRPDEILLHAPRNGRSVYQFACPACHDPVEKPADRTVVALLISAGVDVATPETLLRGPTGEALDRSSVSGDRPSTGSSFSLDDLIDFHFLLQDDVYTEEFLDSQSRLS